MGFHGRSVVKNPPAKAGDVGLIPGLVRSPAIGNSASILSWAFPWTEEPGKLQSMESKKVTRNLATKQYQPFLYLLG